MRFTDVVQRVRQWLAIGSSQPRRLTARPPVQRVGVAVSAGARQDQPGLSTATPVVTNAPSSNRTAQRDVDARTILMQAFDAAHPVERRRELHGRDEQLDTLFDGVLYQRKHAIVYGARGSGKTSLVRVFADHADRQGVVLIYLACDANSRFGDLMRPFLRFVPAGNIPVGRDRAFRAQVDALPGDFGPRALVSLLVELSPKPIIFILDEFDRVIDQAVRDALATTMKLLSDAKAPAQLLVVGIAQSVAELVHHHPSLRRHMIAVPVRRIADEEIARLVDSGASRAHLAFIPEARAMLVRAACGSPYHARLFAYHSGLQALQQGSGDVTAPMARAGLSRAATEWGQLNETDYALFSSLARQGSADRSALAESVGLIAREQSVSPTALEAGTPERLAPALETIDGLTRFRDSLAPQFLIAMLLVSDQAGGIPIRRASPVFGSNN